MANVSVLYPEARQRIVQERSDEKSLFDPKLLWAGDNNELVINLKELGDRYPALENNTPVTVHLLKPAYTVKEKERAARLEGDYTKRPGYIIASLYQEMVSPVFKVLKARPDFPEIMAQIDPESARIASQEHCKKLIQHMEYKKEHPNKTAPFMQA